MPAMQSRNGRRQCASLETLLHVTHAISMIVACTWITASGAVEVKQFYEGARFEAVCKSEFSFNWEVYDFATADLAMPPGAIPTNDSYRIYRMPGRLIITEAQASDNNTGYQCIGEIRDAPIRLISAGAVPARSSGPVDERVEATGGTVELGCPYGEARPPPDTVWYDSMGNVVHTGSATLSNQNYSVPATVTRGGSYRCQATNAGGSVNYTVNLLVVPCLPNVSQAATKASPNSLLLDVSFPCPAGRPLHNCRVTYVNELNSSVNGTQAVSSADCNSERMTAVNITGLDPEGPYRIAVHADNQFGSSRSAESTYFADCPEFSCSVKTAGTPSCYTAGQRCDGTVRCSASGDYADELNCYTAVLQPRDQVFAPSGSTFELACLIPNRTFPSSPTTVQPPIDWYYDYSCDASDRTQPCSRFTRLGSTTTRLQQLNGAVDTLLTTTISNFNTANVGFYSCRVLPLPDISGLKDYPDYLIQQSVSVILSQASPSSVCSTPRYPLTPHLAVHLDSLFYNNSDVVTFTCPFSPESGAMASTCNASTNTWSPPPPYCREPPRLVIATGNIYQTGAMVGVACDVFLSSGEDRFVQVLVEGNGGAISVFQQRAQLLSQGGDLQLTRFSGQVRVLNSTAYTCRLTYVTTSGSSPAIRSSPIFVTALNISSVPFSVMPTIIIPSETANFSCNTTDIRTVNRVLISSRTFGDPMVLYDGRPINNARVISNTVMWSAVNFQFREDTTVTCIVERIGVLQDTVNTTLITAARPPSGTLLAVRGVASSTALLVEVSYRVDDDGGRPTLCEVSYEIGQLERQYTVMVQCVPGVNHTVNITSNVEEYYEYSVRLRVSNAAGSSSSSPLIASVGCREFACPSSRVNGPGRCYRSSDICNGVHNCGTFQAVDEFDCGSLAVPANTVYGAEGLDLAISCTFTTNGRVSPLILSNDTALLATFGPQWTISTIIPPRLPVAECNLNPTIGLAKSASVRRLMNGATEMTAVLRFSNLSICDGVTYRCGPRPIFAEDDGPPSDFDGDSSGISEYVLLHVIAGETCAESDIPTPVNGRKTPDQIFHYGLNATVTFTCNTGFGLVGSTLASCASGGMWTNAAPVCKLDAALEPIIAPMLPIAVVSSNFTLVFEANNTVFPIERVLLVFEDSSSVQAEVPTSRYTVTEVSSAGSSTVRYAVVLMGVVRTDAGRYFVRMTRSGITTPLTSPLTQLSVQVCPQGQIATETRCVADSDGDGIADTLDVCPLDPTNQCNPATLMQCPAEEDSVWSVSWLATVAGAVAVAPCPQSGVGSAVRPCLSSGAWGSPDLSQCGTFGLQEFSSQVVRTSFVAQTTLPEAESDAEELNNLTSSAPILFPADLTATIDVLSVILVQQQFRLGNGTNATSATLRQSFVSTLSTIVGEATQDSWRNLEDVESPTESQSVLNIIEDFTELEAGQMPVNVSAEMRTNVTSPNIELRFVSLVRPEASTTTFVSSEFPSSESVVLPREAFVRTGSTRYAVTAVGGIGALLRSSTFFGNTYDTNSIVLTVLITAPDGTRQTVRDLAVPVQLRIRHINATALRNPTCAFYNFTAPRANGAGTGTWDITGVERDAANSNEDAESITACNTPHLTSFSILVSSTVSGTTAAALRYISYIGCGISLFCLILTAGIFIALKTLHSDHNAIHCNLAISLAIAQILFLVGIERTEVSEVCTAFAILLHYAFLVSFMWMLVEGLQIYFMLVQVFPSSSQRLKKFYLAAYGIPVVIVAITAGIVIEDYGTSTYCWINVLSDTRWAFHGPVIAVILANIVFLVVALRVLFKRSKKKGDTYDAAKASLKGAVVILPLLGVTWVFGLLAVNENTITFHYLFVIFNSFQGLFIFIMHILRNPLVVRALRARYKKYKLGRKDPLSDFSSGHTTTAQHGKRRTDKTISSVQTASTTLKSRSSLPHTAVDDDAQMHEQSTFGRQDGKGQHDMELVQTGGNVNAVTSFGKQQEESHLNSPPQKVPMSVVAMQLADAGSDLEASSDDEEQTKASTPMLTEPQTLAVKVPSVDAIPSSDDEEGVQKSPLFVVGGRQLAGEEQKADTLVPAPVTSESANYSTSATSFGKDPSPLSALPLVDEIMMSLNEEDKKALGGTAPADGSLSSQATSTFKSATDSTSQPEPGKKKKRDWRDATVTYDIRQKVETSVKQGKYELEEGEEDYLPPPPPDASQP